MTQPDPRRSKLDTTDSLTSLTRARTATVAAMWLERLWPLALPFLLVLALFVSVSWLGLFRIVPEWLRLAVTALFALGALVALLPLRRFAAPAVGEIDRRIERTNRLAHAPVSTQSDRLAGADDPFAAALWNEHKRRMAARLGDLGSDLPRTGVPERDPWGLRVAVGLLLVVAFAFSSGPLGGRLTDAFQGPAPREVVPPRIDAWVTPPAYTRKAPLFLNAAAGASSHTVPAGSVVTLRVSGGSGEEVAEFTDSAGTIAPLDAGGQQTGSQATGSQAPGSQAAATPDASAPATRPAAPGVRQFAGILGSDGAVTLRSGDAVVGSWSFTVVPDMPPRISFAGDPKRAVNGTLELQYRIEDDYGPASAEARFAQAVPAKPDARPLYAAPEMPLVLPRPGARADQPAKTSRELTQHPWAGTTVRLVLAAKDHAGQEGSTEPRDLLLPERPFSNPIARAVIEQRRILALDANEKPRVLDLLDAVTLRPEDTFETMAHYLALMSARTRLEMAANDDELRGVVDYLWEIALGIEDGDLSAAEKRLKQAQEALKDALENGASDEEIDRLMAELREAMQEFLREFAERAQQNPNAAQQPPQNGQEMRQSDLERMLDQIENLAKSGSRDKAQEMLSQLQDMMNNLQAGRPQQGQQGQQGQSEMRQQMDKLGEIMRRQQEMMNETFRLDQMQRGQQGQQGQGQGQDGQQGQRGEGQQGQGQQGREPGQQGQGGQGGQGQGGQGGQGPMSPGEMADALRRLQEGQGQLQNDLNALMDGLRGMGMEPGEGFGEAGESMGRAGDALGEAQGGEAVGEQSNALEALRRGAQDMMQQMQQQAQQGDQGGGQEGGRQQNSDRDPLGRPRATTGPDFGDSVDVPDEIDVQRAREILEAIRKRLGDALSPEIERSYLERLLELR